MTSFNTRLGNALKSYKNSGMNLKGLIIEAIDYAEGNNHNPVYIQKIIDAMEGTDKDNMSLIVTTFAPFKVNDGKVKLVGKGAGRLYNVDRGKVDLYVSFRTLAEALAPEKKEKEPFDADKAALNFVRLMRKHGVESGEAVLKVRAAYEVLEGADLEKEVAAEAKRDAKIAKLVAA